VRARTKTGPPKTLSRICALSPVEYQHNHSITALISGKDCYVTGCKDHTIRVFDAKQHTLLFSLDGHEKAVTSLDLVGDDQFLISGSWDGTAKVWNLANQSLVASLSGHENTVSVCALGKEGPVLHIATGSAGIAQNNVISNHSIRIWTVNTETGDVKMVNKVSNDHDGPIRDLCLTSEGMLASCSNDGTVKLRSTDTGEALSTLATMTNDAPMLLSLASSSASSYLASSAEDGNVFVWTGDAPQVIRHASCVWSVTTVPSNGDLITSCQDGTLRIFTQASDRVASEEERTAFSEEVQEALQKTQKGPSQEEVSKLPKWEMNALQQGKSEGQVQLFQKDGVAIAAQWSAASGTWIEVGQVMGTSQDAGMIDGVKYDHVLPIEVDTEGGGVAKLNIGYNNGENPFVAAQRFIDAHMLPQYHLAQIADYIQQRVGTQAPTLGMDTGAAATSAVPAAAMYEHLPVKGYKSFELAKSASLEKMQAKLLETGKLNEKQVEYLASLFETLASTNRYHATKVLREEMICVRDMLKLWPPAEAFPALDLARIMVLHPDASLRDKSEYWNEGESCAGGASCRLMCCIVIIVCS
jgi:phospholipase A-2-activating protein